MLVASDTTDIPQTSDHLAFVVVLTGAGVALLAALAAAALTRRGLRPLSRLADAAGEIERTADPARRLPETGAADEIGQLTGVLNRMLASLEEAHAGERRFLADASHELRTPVTTLLGNVEYAARHGADAEVLDELRRDARDWRGWSTTCSSLERATRAAEERSGRGPCRGRGGCPAGLTPAWMGGSRARASSAYSCEVSGTSWRARSRT